MDDLREWPRFTLRQSEHGPTGAPPRRRDTQRDYVHSDKIDLDHPGSVQTSERAPRPVLAKADQTR
jgi:hypothetical protein